MQREYEQSESIEQIGNRLIAEHHAHLVSAKIAWLLKKLEIDAKGRPIIPKGNPRVGKHVKAATARNVPPLWFCLTGFDFVVAVDERYWIFLTTEQQEALIDHELCHCFQDEDGYYIRDHDVEEFCAILERHGFWRPELETFVSAAPQGNLPFTDPEKPQQSKSVQ